MIRERKETKYDTPAERQQVGKLQQKWLQEDSCDSRCCRYVGSGEKHA